MRVLAMNHPDFDLENDFFCSFDWFYFQNNLSRADGFIFTGDSNKVQTLGSGFSPNAASSKTVSPIRKFL
jgi:hypothetical protein